MMHLQSAAFVHSQIEQEQSSRSANWTKSADDTADISLRVREKVSLQMSIVLWLSVGQTLLAMDFRKFLQLHTAMIAVMKETSMKCAKLT